MHCWMSKTALILALVAPLAACAPNVVVLSPGPVPMPEGMARASGPEAWSLWVSSARDLRPEALTGQKVGVLYTRFEKTPQSALLDPGPAQYVKDQLSRYLLHRGLEASGASTARRFLEIELEECSILENPGSMWDEIIVRLTYAVRVTDTASQEVGRVRLRGEAQRKTPLESKAQVEAALREALGDTFDALARSDVFQKAIQGGM